MPNFSGGPPGGFTVSMDNPEYILDQNKQQQQQQPARHRGNYHTLGIPLVNNSSSPSSSQGPSSIHSAPGQFVQPFSSMTSTGSGGVGAMPLPLAAVGLNGAINQQLGPVPRTPGAGSHQRSSAGEESDEHDYYNDITRRELQPLHPNRTKTPSSSTAGSGSTAPPQLSTVAESPLAKHETTV